MRDTARSSNTAAEVVGRGRRAAVPRVQPAMGAIFNAEVADVLLLRVAEAIGECLRRIAAGAVPVTGIPNARTVVVATQVLPFGTFPLVVAISMCDATRPTGTAAEIL